MLSLAKICVCLVAISPALVAGFTFPGDWHKIRQMMRTRRDKEKLNEEIRDLGLGTRGNFGSSGGIVFPDDDEDEFDWEKFPFSTTTTTTPSPQPLPLDSVMESLMEDVNTTELLVRFGHLDTGLSVRGAFGDAEELPAPPAFSASQSIWNFTMSMIKGGLKEPQSGNSLFSPVSILTTLNMLFLGTQGSTRNEIMSALGYPRYTSDVHTQFQNLINSMNRDIGVTVATSNAMFHQVNFPIKESFKTELRNQYGQQMDIVPLDFTNRPRTTLRRMNGFIAKNTNNLIKDMFKEPVSSTSKLVLSNALYFNASWEYEFLFDPPQYVGIDTEFDSFGKKISLTLMEATFDYPYYRDDRVGMEIISLPYEHDIRNEEISEAHMFLMLPTEKGRKEFEELEGKLPSLNFEEIFDAMDVVFGDVLLPRMEIEFCANLGPHLAQIGIRKMFSGNPSEDFSPITDSWQQLRLDTLQHKAVLRITEKGTEAAAATSAFQFRMIPSITMQFDRPHFLFIYDALNKVVIFWARVVEPKSLSSPLH